VLDESDPLEEHLNRPRLSRLSPATQASGPVEDEWLRDLLLGRPGSRRGRPISLLRRRRPWSGPFTRGRAPVGGRPRQASWQAQRVVSEIL
jgi:hypothetical protein